MFPSRSNAAKVPEPATNWSDSCSFNAFIGITTKAVAAVKIDAIESQKKTRRFGSSRIFAVYAAHAGGMTNSSNAAIKISSSAVWLRRFSRAIRAPGGSSG
jgi:hypothetical protein